MAENFTPERLAFARSRAGLSRARLADLAAVSPRTVANYEDGAHMPGPEVIPRLAKALDVPDAFFFAPAIDEVSPGAVSFRAISKMSAIRRDSALASGSLAIELNRWLEDRLSLPGTDVPTYERGSNDPETAAQRLRFEWDMGYAKIPNLIHILEAHGVRVFSLPEHLVDVDAFSFWWRETPYVLLNCRKSWERGRFDAAHELGHLVLHSDYDLPRGRERELEANRFAAALLMPEQDVLACGLRNASTERVIELKQRWGVSAMALTHRLHELGVTSDWTYTTTCRRLSQMGYRRNEPDTEGTSRETSKLLTKALKLLKERGVNQAEIARQLHVHPETLHGLLFGLVVTPLKGSGQKTPSRGAHLRLVDDPGI